MGRKVKRARRAALRALGPCLIRPARQATGEERRATGHQPKLDSNRLGPRDRSYPPTTRTCPNMNSNNPRSLLSYRSLDSDSSSSPTPRLLGSDLAPMVAPGLQTSTASTPLTGPSPPPVIEHATDPRRRRRQAPLASPAIEPEPEPETIAAVEVEPSGELAAGVETVVGPEPRSTATAEQSNTRRFQVSRRGS